MLERSDYEEVKEMDLQITGKNMELTPTIHRYIERKLDKLNRHLPNIIDARVEVSAEKTKSPQQHFVVKIALASRNTKLHGEERGDDVFTAIDRVVEIIDRQIEHHKGKLYKKNRGDSLAKSEFSPEVDAVESEAKVVRVKRFILKPMSVDEAIDQMELLGHDFFMFFNSGTEELNLLYQRKDGDYGLIETELG